MTILERIPEMKTDCRSTQNARGHKRGRKQSQRVAGITFLVAGVTAGAQPASAQLAGGGLTDPGYSGAVGTSRDAVSSFVSGPSPVTVRPWSFSGSVDVEVGATDSPGGINNGWQPVILIAPDLFFTGTTSRLNVALGYSPRLAIYPSSSDQTLISQNFNGSVNATIVPDLLYLNLRGISSLSSRFGNTSTLSNSFVSKSEAVQTTSVSISPYLQRTFGTHGTATVGYVYAQTFQDGDNDFSSTYFAPNAAQTAGFGTTGNLQTNTEYGSYVTGEDLGRFQYALSASANQYSGSYFYQGASTYSITNRLSYLVYRWLTVFVTGGYENYDYPHSGYRLNQPTWTVGVTLTPNESSELTVQYGQVSGIDTILANATYSPTARTRIFGSYTVGIETGLGARQALLGSTSVGVGGVLLDNLSGAPTLANSYLASQSPLSRVKTATIGGALLLDRDSFTVTAGHSEFEQLGNSVSILGVATPVGTKTSTSYVSGTWQHELNPSTSLYTGATYSISDNGVYYGAGGASQDTLQLYTSLNHVFTDTLSGSLTYNHAERFGNAARNLPAAFGGSASQNTVLVGLRKSF